jgi:leucyl aminopeptidase (aminopeptidase T)
MDKKFPEFDLKRLMSTVFGAAGEQKVCILIDLNDPRDVKDFAFLDNEEYSIQKNGYEHFYQAFQNGVMAELGWTGGEMFAYEVTGGSNLDMEDEAFDTNGAQVSLEEDIYKKYDIILCISTYSATAPLTAWAKKIGFRGATLHGLNEIILSSGLAVDYNEISVEAEKLRAALTKADEFEIDYEVKGRALTLKLICGQQEAQKSHGLCPPDKPDVANLPAGEVYFVPTGAEGQFPMKYSDGTLGVMNVRDGRIHQAELISGNSETIKAHNTKLQDDPVTGELGELGFGTQELPVSGRDIQDEKIRGTIHVATGRSDHLGGNLTPDRFAKKHNATHDDILFAPFKTPEINIPQVRMFRDGETTVILENYKTAPYLENALSA